MNIDSIKFVPAKYYTKVETLRFKRVIVAHDMEYPETSSAAESIANYFHTITEKYPSGKPKKPSAHINIDNDSAVRCVRDNDVANAAPGANHDGLQLEMAGFGRQTRAQWLDDYSKSMLVIGADVCAQWCVKHNIPPRHLTDAQLADGTSKGIVGHYQVSRVFKLSDHTDPGTGFPWGEFILAIGALVTKYQDTPRPGARRWSNYFKKTQGQGWIVLVKYNNDTDWFFHLEGTSVVLKAQTPWSQMPKQP